MDHQQPGVINAPERFDPQIGEFDESFIEPGFVVALDGKCHASTAFKSARAQSKTVLLDPGGVKVAECGTPEQAVEAAEWWAAALWGSQITALVPVQKIEEHPPEP